MSTQLVKIHPPELIFTFEVKKQSSCVVHLANVSDQYVAFKVKTTSPKKYCVRPNIGIIKPKSTSDFTVTMQAQRSAPSDMQCKDKFLIQSTVVPSGITEEDITTDLFAKDNGNYVEEYKLRVVLISPPHSPVLLPINGVLKQEPSFEASIQKDKLLGGAENLPPPNMPVKDVEDVNNAMLMEEPRPAKIVEDKEFHAAKIVDDREFNAAKIVEDKECHAAKIVDDREFNAAKIVENKEFHAAKIVDDREFNAATIVEDKEFNAAKDVEPRPIKDVERTKLNLTKEVEDLKLKLNGLDSKLIETEFTISKLKEERSVIIQDKETLEQELALLRRNSGVRRVQMGFPLLFVCMVAVISLTVGYFLHP